VLIRRNTVGAFGLTLPGVDGSLAGMFDGQSRARCQNLLVVLATGMFAAELCFVPPTLFEGLDYVRFYRGNFQLLADAVREGFMPLWNPYIDLGRPYLADMQNAVFYPPLYLVCLGQGLGLFLLVWLHCLVAVFGMRRLAGALEVGRWQSYFMAFSYLASGALTARWMIGQVLYCCALCYVPWLFYCASRTEEAWQSRRIALYGLLLALQFLCGHPQVFWFTGIGQVVFMVGRTLRRPWQAALREAGRDLCQLGAACLGCLGLVAVVLLPFLELVQHGNRVGASPTFTNFFKLEWDQLGSLISPIGLSGKSSWINWEMNLFVGPIVVLLGLAGLCLVRERNVRGLLAVLVVSLMIAVGDNTLFFGLCYKWLPGFAGFRCHVRAALLVVLVLTCGAGIWLSRPHPCLRSLGTYKFNCPVGYVVSALVCLQGLGLMYATWVIKRTYSYSAVCRVSPKHPFQKTLVAQLRGWGLMQPFQQPPRICVAQWVVPANYAMVYRYSTFDAYTSLFLRRPWDYLHAMLGIRPPELQNNQVAEVVYSHGPFPYPDLALAAGIAPATGILQVATNPAPRAFLVYAAEVVGDYNTILTRLAKGHDISRSALLEKRLAEPLPRESVLPGTAALIVRFEPNSVWVEVEAKEKALLVLAEAWYPGWRAEIDGRVCACVPANLWMRALPVPAGRHQVRLYFHQNYLLLGLLISLASAGLLLLVLSWAKRRAG
jgi:Bacterial membrane protein YfhO